jgi:chemotaxis family two-component system response regulator Rcp1
MALRFCSRYHLHRTPDVLQILLAEDNRGDVMLVQKALEEHHLVHELHVVSDGEEALEFIRDMGKSAATPCPDLLVLDLNLPKVDGSEVLSEFRKHPECLATPVIVMSSSDAPRDRTKINALGVNHYFRKPTDLDAFMELGAVVRQVARGNSD